MNQAIRPGVARSGTQNPFRKGIPPMTRNGIKEDEGKVLCGSSLWHLCKKAAELGAGVFCHQLSVYLPLTSLAVACPRKHLADQSCDARGTGPKALPRQDTQFTFGTVEPTAMLGRGVNLQPLGPASRLFRRKDFVPRSDRMHVQLVPDEDDLLGLRRAAFRQRDQTFDQQLESPTVPAFRGSARRQANPVGFSLAIEFRGMRGWACFWRSNAAVKPSSTSRRTMYFFLNRVLR